MALPDIIALPVSEIAAPDSVLLMWSTSPKLQEALQVLQSWGFEYKTCAVWDKCVIGMGYYFRQQHELLLIGTMGALPTPEAANRASSLIKSEREVHSKKPEVVYEIIETMYPEYNKIELFSRQKRKGWDSFGNEAK